MDLSQLERFQFYDEGVTYTYLVLEFELQGQTGQCLRALNYLPHEADQTKAILKRFDLELKELGLSAQNIQVLGGGSITRNPYYETVSLFGANLVYGAEADREECSKWVEAALPGESVKWHPPEAEAPKKPKPPKTPPAKKAEESQEVASQESST